MSLPNGWTRHPSPFGQTGAHYSHPSGWSVDHCGHPTALWPYYVTAPAGLAAGALQRAIGRAKLSVSRIMASAQIFVAPNGLGFRRVSEARAAAEELAALASRAEVQP